MQAVIRTVIFYCCTIGAMLIALVPVGISILLPERYRYNIFCFFCIDLVYRAMLLGTLLPVKVIGTEHLIVSKNAIYIANHQSALDIPLVGRLLGRKPHVWLIKSELAKMPFLGFVGRRLAVVVDRSSLRKSLQTLIDAVQLTKEKHRSLILFPEGSRFTDQKIHAFLPGFAVLAKKVGLPVVPIVISGSGLAMPQGSWLLNKQQPLKVLIGTPFQVDQNESEEAFMQRVHSWFLMQTVE